MTDRTARRSGGREHGPASGRADLHGMERWRLGLNRRREGEGGGMSAHSSAVLRDASSRREALLCAAGDNKNSCPQDHTAAQ